MNSKAKANDWTYQDTLSPESLSSPPTGEYIKILSQSRQVKVDVIIGPREIGDGRGHGSSEVRSRLDYKLGNLPPLHLWRLSFTNPKKRAKREEGEPASADLMALMYLSPRNWVINYQSLLPAAYYSMFIAQTTGVNSIVFQHFLCYSVIQICSQKGNPLLF